MNIKTNISSINTGNLLRLNNASLDAVMERLSSGKYNLKYKMKTMTNDEVYEEIIMKSSFSHIKDYMKQLEEMNTDRANELLQRIQETESIRLKLLVNDEGEEK